MLHHETPQYVPTLQPLEVALAQGQVWSPRSIRMPFALATTEAKSSGCVCELSVSFQPARRTDLSAAHSNSQDRCTECLTASLRHSRQNEPAATAARGQMVALTDLPKSKSRAGEGSKHGARPAAARAVQERLMQSVVRTCGRAVQLLKGDRGGGGTLAAREVLVGPHRGFSSE